MILSCIFCINFRYNSIKHNKSVSGLKKKLLAAATRDNEPIRQWIPAIVNHLYWAATTSLGNEDEALAKWASVANHIVDTHIHDNPLYPACQHPPLDDRPWLVKGMGLF